MSQPQRYNAHNPCPVCLDAPPICNGYRGLKEGIAFCTQSGMAGGLSRGSQGQYKHWLLGGCNCGVTHGYPPPLSFPEKKKMTMTDAPVSRTLEATFDYGGGCYVDRFLTEAVGSTGKKKKTFTQYQILEGQKIFQGFKRLYPRIELRRWGKTLIYVEGEKKVDALLAQGIQAFCWPGGSGGWSDEAAELYCAELAGKFILIWPDNDEAGLNLADKMQARFKKHGIKSTIMHKLLVGLPQTGDVLDWLTIPGNDIAKLADLFTSYLPTKRLFLVSEYGLIPATEWLLEPLFIERALTLTVGESEVGKSYIMLHYALRICAELGRQVVYLGLESFSQYPERVLAWLEYYKAEVGKNFILSSYPLQLLDKASVEGFIGLLQENSIKPAMIIIDTYHAATEGADEISGQDTGLVLGSLKMIRDLLETNVNCIHHLNAAGLRERGHTSLKAAMDTMLTLKAEGDGVALECGKQRMAKHFTPLSINWAYLDNGSRVVVESNQAVKVDFSRLGKNDQKLLRILGSELHRAKGLRYREIMDQAGIPSSSLANTLAKCRQAGWVNGSGETTNIITNEGLEMIGYVAGDVSEY